MHIFTSISEGGLTSKRRGRKEIPRADKEEIWRLTEVEGLLPPEIARRLGHDNRTIHKYVDKRARDRAKHEASVQVFRSAMEAHHEDLGTIAAGIKSSMALPERLFQSVTDPTFHVLEVRLYSGFEQHLAKSAFWRYLASWNNAAARWQTLANGLLELFNQEVASKSRITLAETPEALGWLREIKDLISEAVMQEVKSLAAIWPTEDPWQRDEPRTGNVLISIGERDVLRLDSCSEPKPAVEALVDAWADIRESSELKELKEGVWVNLQSARDSAHLELDTLLLRRVFPGGCRFCPG